MWILLSAGCAVNNSQLENSCILSEIQFSENNTLKFITISGGRIYQIKQEFVNDDDEVVVLAFFQFNYYIDSLVVINQFAENQKFPYMTVQFDGDRPLRVQKFFGASGVRLIHEMDYSNEDRILVDLYREASDGQILFAGYSNYYTDVAGNVTRNERYFVDRDDPSIFTKFEDISFVYDQFNSPQQNLYLPFFTDTNFPDVRFFSPNNITQVHDEESVENYQYNYDQFGNMTSMIQPDGSPIYYRYIACGN